VLFRDRPAAIVGAVPKKYRDVKQILSAAGWTVARRSRGSHEQWVSPDRTARVTVASGGKENREVPAPTLSRIRRATGLEELR
jgi:predicted RNA binding protein YcfA (HicA-like mRNA interferase family)